MERNGSLKKSIGDHKDDDGKCVNVKDFIGIDDESKLKDLSLNSEVTINGSRESKKIQMDSSEDIESETKCESKKLNLKALEEELGLLETAVELAFDDQQHSVDFHIEKLIEKVEAKRISLQDLNFQWEATRYSLEAEKKTLQKSLYTDKSDTREKLESLEEVELETQKVLDEIRKRKSELSKVTEELENQPKGASRKSHIDRINEITKNSRKQDTDIERILKDTREIQIESNAVQERLHRTYAIVDEMVFREAKKDPVGRQAYRLLTSFHESFEQIAEKIMATDRVRREVAEREKKLAAMSNRSSNTEKLQADLDAIVRENELLEKKLNNKKLSPLCCD